MSRDSSNDPTFDGGGVTRSSRITCKVKGDSKELKATRGILKNHIQYHH